MGTFRLQITNRQSRIISESIGCEHIDHEDYDLVIETEVHNPGFWSGKKRGPECSAWLRSGHTPEMHKRHSELMKLKFLDPEYKSRNAEFHAKRRGTTRTNETKAKISNTLKEQRKDIVVTSNTKDWTFVNPEGKVVTTHNLQRYCRDHELDPRYMRHLMYGQRKTYKGYTRNA